MASAVNLKQAAVTEARAKWKKVLADMNVGGDGRVQISKQAIRLAYSGIPSELRGKLWHLAS
eukprot:gene25928-31738_t